jgi:hypothetical protein
MLKFVPKSSSLISSSRNFVLLLSREIQSSSSRKVVLLFLRENQLGHESVRVKASLEGCTKEQKC